MTAAAVSRDHQPRGFAIALAPHGLPPTADRIDREASCIMVDADADPTGVVGDVMESVGCSPAKGGVQEVVHPDFFWIALGTILPAVVLEVADQLFLLGIDRNSGLIGRQRGLHLDRE